MPSFNLTSMILENHIQEFVVRWYFLPNSSDAYCIGSDGVLWSRYIRVRRGWAIGGMDAWRRLALNPDKDGYLICGLKLSGKMVTVKIHQVVAELFIGPRPIGLECCHNDGTRKNNHVCNLRYDTPTSNQRDRVKHGTDDRGERFYGTNLNWGLVGQIREEYATGKYSQRELGEKYGVDRATIGYIVRHETWVLVEA